jgi:hypothetical protein
VRAIREVVAGQPANSATIDQKPADHMVSPDTLERERRSDAASLPIA